MSDAEDDDDDDDAGLNAGRASTGASKRSMGTDSSLPPSAAAAVANAAALAAGMQPTASYERDMLDQLVGAAFDYDYGAEDTQMLLLHGAQVGHTWSGKVVLFLNAGAVGQHGHPCMCLLHDIDSRMSWVSTMPNGNRWQPCMHHWYPPTEHATYNRQHAFRMHGVWRPWAERGGV